MTTDWQDYLDVERTRVDTPVAVPAAASAFEEWGHADLAEFIRWAHGEDECRHDDYMCACSDYWDHDYDPRWEDG